MDYTHFTAINSTSICLFATDLCFDLVPTFAHGEHIPCYQENVKRDDTQCQLDLGILK